METLCDHKSVGIVIQNEKGDVLLLDRARFPFGLAPPAGHVDEHGSLEQTAIDETFEEVGLHISDLHPVIEERRVGNTCRRLGGDHHIWTVFTAGVTGGELTPNVEETKGVSWRSLEQLQVLADRTHQSTSREYKLGAQVLEPIWLDFFTELGLVRT